jgi:hypothetical protein
MPKFHTVPVKRVYPEWAGETYKVNDSGTAEDLARKAGFDLVTVEKEHVNHKTGYKWTTKEVEYSVQEYGKYDWNKVFVGLEVTQAAIDIAVREEGLLTSHAQVCSGIDLHYEGGQYR